MTESWFSSGWILLGPGTGSGVGGFSWGVIHSDEQKNIFLKLTLANVRLQHSGPGSSSSLSIYYIGQAEAAFTTKTTIRTSRSHAFLSDVWWAWIWTACSTGDKGNYRLLTIVHQSNTNWFRFSTRFPNAIDVLGTYTKLILALWEKVLEMEKSLIRHTEYTHETYSIHIVYTDYTH